MLAFIGFIQNNASVSSYCKSFGIWICYNKDCKTSHDPTTSPSNSSPPSNSPSTPRHNTVNITQQSERLKQMCVYTKPT